jgi:FkbM family methyltransferase
MQPAAICMGVKVPPSSKLTPTRIARLNEGRYEGQEIAGILEVVGPDDRVLELGAGIGVVGAVAAHNGQPQQVLSFEANPELIDIIHSLYDMNGLDGRISVRNEILLSAPDRPETIPFHISNSYLGSSLSVEGSRKAREVAIPTASFEDVRQEFDPTVLVIDIEGGELDLLRHANLDSIRAVVIEFHPNVYGIEGMKECKTILRDAGFERVAKVSTRVVWTCVKTAPAAVPIAPPLPDGGWSEQIETLDQATVVPAAQSAFVQEAGVLRADGNHCETGAFWRNFRPLTVAPPLPEAAEPLAGKWLWGGVMWMHFGHFIVESTSCLWALDRIEGLDGILFIPKRPKVGDKLVGFQRDFFQQLGIDMPIKVLTAPTQVERLVVPGQGFGLGPIIAGTQPFRDFIHGRFGHDVGAEGGKRLYISRSRIGLRKGALIGEDRLEAYLRDHGYEIFHPEAHDLTTQIARYKAADQIIAAEGSALHLFAMVAQPHQKVAIVARRRSGATVQIENHLKSFGGVTPVTIDKIVRSWMPHESVRKRMALGELDMPALQIALAARGFIEAGGPPWQSLEEAEVSALLDGKFEVRG